MPTFPTSTRDTPETVPFLPPERFNMTDYFLEDRIREGRGGRTAVITDDGRLTYEDVRARADRFGHVLREAGVEPEQRVMIALRDGPDFVAALFGTLKIGGVVVMANPDLDPEAIGYFLGYTRAVVLVVGAEDAGRFREGRRAAAGEGGDRLKAVLVPDEEPVRGALAEAPDRLEPFPTHRDDAAIWLFSGGTTGRPKAVIQTHASYANTTECYAKRVVGYREDDVTLAVPKLYFGYATGSNLLFPFAAGAASVLWPERCTAEALFEKVETHRPTILVNVPTMVGRLVAHPEASERDLSSLRLSTSAGEALPVDLHRRWRETFGVELLDGLGTAEMWHIFLSNRPGEVRPGTLGRAVPGFDVRVCDDDGRELPDGETGWLWVRGGSRAVAYWQRMEATQRAFRGEWYVSGDMVRRDEDGFFTYRGRGDDMLKVSGKWLAPKEVEDCLVEHPAVREAVVVGVEDAEGLTKPHAFVVPTADAAGGDGEADGLEERLQAYVRERLAPYKYPRRVVFVDDLPRTHLGKVDRAAVRRSAGGGG